MGEMGRNGTNGTWVQTDLMKCLEDRTRKSAQEEHPLLRRASPGLLAQPPLRKGAFET